MPLTETPTKQKHKKACSYGMRAQKGKLTKFLKRYPNYCRTCSAYGIIWEHDFEGILEDYPCPDCIASELCPRCMTETMIDKQEELIPASEGKTALIHYWQTCTICGWRGDDDYGDHYSLPREPICVCSVIREE